MTATITNFEHTVKRITLEEAAKAAEDSLAVGENKTRLPFPKWVRMRYLKKRFERLGFGFSDHSIMYYRAIAFEEVAEYQKLCLDRYPEYWEDLAQEAMAISAAKKAGIDYPYRRRLKPDKLPLTTRQAEIVEEIAELMKEWQDHLLVREQLNKRYKQPE